MCSTYVLTATNEGVTELYIVSTGCTYVHTYMRAWGNLCYLHRNDSITQDDATTMTKIAACGRTYMAVIHSRSTTYMVKIAGFDNTYMAVIASIKGTFIAKIAACGRPYIALILRNPCYGCDGRNTNSDIIMETICMMSRTSAMKQSSLREPDNKQSYIFGSFTVRMRSSGTVKFNLIALSILLIRGGSRKG